MMRHTNNNLYVTGYGPGILYGLPKVHKANFRDNFPFRPIFAAYKTAPYKLAKFSCSNFSSIY